MIQQILTENQERLMKVIDAMTSDFAGVRVGRASAAMLDRITVEYYGSETPLNQIAGISIPDSRTLMIQPWDKGAMAAIEKAIMKSDLGMTPSNDGSVIRLVVPQMTEERRKEVVKTVKKRSEEARVAARNVRRDANDKIKDIEKKKLAPEDDCKWGVEEVQKQTDDCIKKIDTLCEKKEKEVMSV